MKVIFFFLVFLMYITVPTSSSQVWKKGRAKKKKRKEVESQLRGRTSVPVLYI